MLRRNDPCQESAESVARKVVYAGMRICKKGIKKLVKKLVVRSENGGDTRKNRQALCLTKPVQTRASPQQRVVLETIDTVVTQSKKRGLYVGLTSIDGAKTDKPIAIWLAADSCWLRKPCIIIPPYSV